MKIRLKTKQRNPLNRKMIALSLPLMAVTMFFFVLPMLLTIGHSLQESSFSTRMVFLDNYRKVWQNSYYRLAVKNTLMVTATTVSLTMAGAVAIARLMQAKPKMSGIGVPCLLLPMFIPTGAVAGIWRNVFQTSAFSTALVSYAALVSLFVWKYIGAGSVVLYYGLTQIPQEVKEAAALDGASGWKHYRLIELPMIRSYSFMSLMLVMMYSFRIYKESYLLFGEYPSTELYMLQHYMSNHFRKMSYPNVAVGAVSLCVLMLLPCLAAFIRLRTDGEGELI